MREVPVRSLIRSWVSDEPAPAYVLGGEGARLSEMLAEELVSRFRKEGETAELVHWNGSDLERESPDAAWRSPSFFFRRRVFHLPDAGEWKQGPRKEILRYLESPDPSVLLVVPCFERRARALCSPVRGIRTAFLGEEDVVAAMAEFAVSRASEGGKSLSEDAAVFLARWVGSDFPRFRAEMGKLLSFGPTRGEIGEEEIREVCVAGNMVDPFRLADDLMVRDRKGCLGKFRRFAAAADTGDYHALVGAIAWSVRRKMSAAAQPGKGIGMRYGRKRETFTASRGGEILTALSRIDGDLKGGSGLTPEQVVEIALLKLLA
jgi:DNA polymerase III delta subunit